MNSEVSFQPEIFELKILFKFSNISYITSSNEFLELLKSASLKSLPNRNVPSRKLPQLINGNVKGFPKNVAKIAASKLPLIINAIIAARKK